MRNVSWMKVARAGILAGFGMIVGSLLICDLADVIAENTTHAQQFAVVLITLALAAGAGILAEYRIARWAAREDRRAYARNTRSGFTLVELMIVILIISILAGLLITAAIGVKNQAHFAAAKNDVMSLDIALGNFKIEMGSYPPSYISFIPETNSAGDTVLPVETVRVLRGFFPRINFNVDSSKGATPLITDLTALGIWNKELHGRECLVLFLGGRWEEDSGLIFMNGFSKNRERPFIESTATGRIGPFIEFDNQRLKTDSRFDYPVYVDSLPGQTEPILYLSTEPTHSYRLGDADIVYQHDGNAIPFRAYKLTETKFEEPNRFQLISPGWDKNYGHGGYLDATDPPHDSAADPGFVDAPDYHDEDNITNF